jgi:hypothetical protein
MDSDAQVSTTLSRPYKLWRGSEENYRTTTNGRGSHLFSRHGRHRYTFGTSSSQVRRPPGVLTPVKCRTFALVRCMCLNLEDAKGERCHSVILAIAVPIAQRPLRGGYPSLHTGITRAVPVSLKLHVHYGASSMLETMWVIGSTGPPQLRNNS